jgi:hypothetical protein
MPLAEQQRALAALYTSEASRARLGDDPLAFARAFELTERESAHFATIDAARLHAYADGLDRKRLLEAARVLPLSAERLGRAFRTAFLAYARAVPLGDGPVRYRDDALAFARRRPVHPLVAFEADALRASARPFAFAFAMYPFDVRATLGRASVVSGATLVVRVPFRRTPFLLRLRPPGGLAAPM